MGKYTLKLPNNYELKISSDLEGSIRSFVAKVEIVSKIEGEVSVTIEGYFLFCLSENFFVEFFDAQKS